jgi:hypothetical protein
MKETMVLFVRGLTMLSVPNTCLLWFRIYIHVSHTDIVVSDHLPLFFHFDIQYSSLSPQSSHTSACNHIHRIDWSKVSSDNIDVYRSMVSSKLLEFPADVFLCFDSHCSVHSDQLDFYADHVVSVLLNCAVACFPSRISSSKNVVGWNDCASNLRKDSIFLAKSLGGGRLPLFWCFVQD